jgi:hypothetical protein
MFIWHFAELVRVDLVNFLDRQIVLNNCLKTVANCWVIQRKYDGQLLGRAFLLR